MQCKVLKCVDSYLPPFQHRIKTNLFNLILEETLEQNVIFSSYNSSTSNDDIL